MRSYSLRMEWVQRWSFRVAALAASLHQCGCTVTPGDASGGNTNSPPVPNTNGNVPGGGGITARGFLTFRAADDHVYLLEVAEGAEPQDVTASLDALSSRAADDWLNLSPDGQWLLLATERFDPECAGYSCLAVVSIDFSEAGVVRAAGNVVHPDGFSAISTGGNLVVFTSTDGPHAQDLWATRRGEDGWNSPALLTGASPFEYNHQPALSDDGASVVFDCGPAPYGQEGTSICEVRTDGSSFRTVLTPADAPPGFAPGGALHHPDYGQNSELIFEANWDGERIWRLPVGSTVPAEAFPGFGNDNSACALQGGSVASLWLGREGSAGTHEVKVASVDDPAAYLIVFNQNDVADIGIGCGGG